MSVMWPWLDHLLMRRSWCSQCGGPILVRHRRRTCSPGCADQQTIDEGV